MAPTAGCEPINVDHLGKRIEGYEGCCAEGRFCLSNGTCSDTAVDPEPCVEEVFQCSSYDTDPKTWITTTDDNTCKGQVYNNTIMCVSGKNDQGDTAACCAKRPASKNTNNGASNGPSVSPTQHNGGGSAQWYSPTPVPTMYPPNSPEGKCEQSGGYWDYSAGCVKEGEYTTRCFRYAHAVAVGGSKSHTDINNCYAKLSGSNYAKRACVSCPTGPEQLYVEDRALVIESQSAGDLRQGRLESKLDKEVMTVQLRPFNNKQKCTAVFKSGMEFLTVTDENGKEFNVVINFMKLTVCKSKQTKASSNSGSALLGEGSYASGASGGSNSSAPHCAVEKSIGRCLVGAILASSDEDAPWSAENLFAGHADCKDDSDCTALPPPPPTAGAGAGAGAPPPPQGKCVPRPKRTALSCSKGYREYHQQEWKLFTVNDEGKCGKDNDGLMDSGKMIKDFDAQGCGKYCKCNKGWSGNKCQIPDVVPKGVQNVTQFPSRRRGPQPNKSQKKEDLRQAKDMQNWPLVPCDATWTSAELQNAGKLALIAAASYV